MDFDEFEAWFRDTAAGIYAKQRQEAARRRRFERQKQEEADEAARTETDRLRVEKRSARFKELLYAVRQEIVVTLGLKSKKYRAMLPIIEGISTIEKLGEFCRSQVKHLPNFDISSLNEARDVRHLLGELGMLAHLNALELDQLSATLKVLEKLDGEHIMTQEETGGNEMYIIDDGKCNVEIDGNIVAELERGRYFGELALLRDVPRNASILAKGKCRLLALTRSAFDEFIEPVLRTAFIFEQVPLLAPLSFDDRLKLARAVSKRVFIGSDIMVQGEPGDTMYVIIKGEAAVSIQGQGEVARNKIGDWFGEAALMTDGARVATVTAIGTCECLELTRDAFDQYVFGHMDNPHLQAELVLARVPLLSGIPAQQRSKLAAEMTVSNYQNGEIVIKQGDVGDCMYVLESGSVKVEVVAVGEVARFEEGQFSMEES